MTDKKAILWKMDALMAFVDMKVLLLAWVLINLYRNTELLADMNLSGFRTHASLLHFIWAESGSPFLLVALGAIVGDVIVKRVLKNMIER